MIPINGSNSSGVDLNKYVLKNVFNNVVNGLSEDVNKNKLDIEDIKNKVDGSNDKFEWLAFDVSNEYTSEYNMKRCFNKYGDSFLIRESSITQLQDYEIHECHVKTDYGPNIQYKFISDYVYLPAYIRDKDNDKIIYHIAECDLLMNKNTVNCTTKKIEFGEGWNRVLVRFSSTFEHIKINSDCLNLGIGDNPNLKDVDISECYQLNSCEISGPLFKDKCFTTRCTPTTFATTNNNNTYLDITQNWFISGDGIWRGKFLAGWHHQDVEFFDRLGNGLIARIDDANNDSGFYKTVTGHDIITDYFKFPSMVLFSNDLYNDKRLVHVPRVAMNVYTNETFETNAIISNARILDFSNGIIAVDWTYDNKVEKIIVSPSLTSLNLKYDTALTSLNLVDCDKLDSLTIQNCPNITKIVLQHRPTTLNLDSTIKLIVIDEMENNITTLDSSVSSINNIITPMETNVSDLSIATASLGTRVTALENKPAATQSLFGPRYTTTPANLTDINSDFEIHDNYTNNDWHISKTECYYKGGYSSTTPKLLFPPCLNGYITQNLTLSAAKSGSDMLYNLDIDLSGCCTRNLEFNGVTVSASIVLPEFFLYYAFTTGSDACNFSLNNAHISAQICELKLNGQYMQFNASGSSCNKLGDLTKIQLILTQCHKSRIEPITYNGQSSNIFNVVKAWV